jgi:uncharacterized protein YjbJ (UPF0337 family)
MKLKGLLRKVAMFCCTLVALFGFQVGLQATSFLPGFTSSVAIASPLDGQLVADNYIGNAPNSRAARNEAKADIKSAFDKVAGAGSANRIEGKAEQGYGKAQQDLGNARSQFQGSAHQVQGNAKQATGKAQNAVENATENVQEKASDAIDAVKDFFNK